MLYSEPPGCDAAPMSPVFMSKKRAVRAFLMEMSMLPSQAPSMRAKALRFPPASTTAMFIKVSISAAFCCAASTRACACAKVMSPIDFSVLSYSMPSR